MKILCRPETQQRIRKDSSSSDGGLSKVQTPGCDSLRRQTILQVWNKQTLDDERVWTSTPKPSALCLFPFDSHPVSHFHPALSLIQTATNYHSLVCTAASVVYLLSNSLLSFLSTQTETYRNFIPVQCKACGLAISYHSVRPVWTDVDLNFFFSSKCGVIQAGTELPGQGNRSFPKAQNELRCLESAWRRQQPRRRGENEDVSLSTCGRPVSTSEPPPSTFLSNYTFKSTSASKQVGTNCTWAVTLKWLRR